MYSPCLYKNQIKLYFCARIDIQTNFKLQSHDEHASLSRDNHSILLHKKFFVFLGQKNKKVPIQIQKKQEEEEKIHETPHKQKSSLFPAARSNFLH